MNYSVVEVMHNVDLSPAPRIPKTRDVMKSYRKPLTTWVETELETDGNGTPDRVHVSKRTRRRYNSGVYDLTLDTAFAAVIEGCAAPRSADEGTWITPGMADAYTTLHRRGHAHSLEVWADGELAGGIYGLALGGVFFGESMFSRRTDASKIALIALCRLLAAHGYGLLDCQVENDHLLRMGAERIAREAFEAELERLVDQAVDATFWRASRLQPERW
ncbi:MAG: leucyl/phenylalanyl-tRNA--protein transferase [Xanthomonadales bacterium]